MFIEIGRGGEMFILCAYVLLRQKRCNLISLNPLLYTTYVTPEIACLPEGPREEGKWPWGNFPSKNPRYQQYLDENRLHCGDGNVSMELSSLFP